MLSSRHQARLLLATVTVAAALSPFAVMPATATYGPLGYAEAPVSTALVTVPMTFPVIGPTSYTDTYLACRSGCARRHFGQDLMGPKMRQAVAVFNGVVHSIKRETSVGDGNYITIKGDNGWSANYIHMNNDTPGTDDGRGTAGYFLAPGMREGKRVYAGELLGWVGDSGNAEGTAPHLHFELRKGDPWSGTVYNAFSSLNHARRLSKPTTSGPHPEGVYVRSCSLCPVYALDDGRKRYLRKEVAREIAFDVRTVVPVTQNEVYSYPKGADLQLPGGRAYRTPDGAVWFVMDGRRWHLPTREAIAALGIPLARVRSTTDTGIRTVPLAPADWPLPTGIVYNGALYRVPATTGHFWYVADGARRLVTDAATLVSWGLKAEDAITLPEPPVVTDPPVEEVVEPEDELELPPLGAVLPLKDGALVKDGAGRRYVVTNGTKRPFDSWPLFHMYGYTNVLQQAPGHAVVTRIPTGPRLP